MANKKTSAEKAREDAENEQVDNLLDGAFGTLSGLGTNKTNESHENELLIEEHVSEEIVQTDVNALDESVNLESPASDELENDVDNSSMEIENHDPEEEAVEVNQGTTGPPPLPPSGPPSKGPPSGPPSKGPPSGPPSKGPPSGPPSSPPPSPPSKGPPSSPPSSVMPDEPSIEQSIESSPVEIASEESQEIEAQRLDTNAEENNVEINEKVRDNKETEVEEAVMQEEVETVIDYEESSETPVEEGNDNQETEVEDVSIEGINEAATNQEEGILDLSEDSEENTLEDGVATRNMETEAEIARLSAEVERLRMSMAGAAEVIEELENPPMPPAIMDDLVIGAHIVADMSRLARQLDREQLIRASMGTIALLHPDQLEVIISTKHMAMLPRMDERDICASKLGVDAPRGAPDDWRVLEVVLASVSLITGGPAAVIHSHGPFTTAASCEKDLVLVQPIDEIGKKHIGKIIIVDPDDENPEEFLRQVAEALQQGGMRCVVIRGKGAYAVGAGLDQAWANAAMLEHSMKIVLLARQANLKV